MSILKEDASALFQLNVGVANLMGSMVAMLIELATRILNRNKALVQRQALILGFAVWFHVRIRGLT